jgi:isoaspartyl peptidase/L-asparaginase-like protein (Ntn-hydrolase superfamily)
MDAVESAIKTVELSTDGSAASSVGRTGLPNAAGVLQLDACVMNGPDHQAGAVAAVEGVLHPISAARLVMERSPHVMMVGEGARWFAEQQGLEVVQCEESDRAAHDAWRAAQTARSGPARMPSGGEAGGFGGANNHDTVALLVLNEAGDIAGGCSTSGWGGKLPGRVGDSPIIGSGLYVDNQVGAAGATGLGEHVMQNVVSYQIVENMRHGMSPQKACHAAIERCVANNISGEDLSMNFVALDKQGRFGAAGTGNFPFSVATASFSEVREVQGFSAAPQPAGGNVHY